MLLFQPSGDGEEATASLVLEDAVHQFGHVCPVKLLAFIFSERDDLHAGLREYFRVEAGLHGEAGAEESKLLEAESLGRGASGFDNADERYGCLPRDVIED